MEGTNAHMTTFFPLATAASTWWCDISPVRYTSASTPRSISPPEPALIATDRTAGMSLADVYATRTIRTAPLLFQRSPKIFKEKLDGAYSVRA